MFCSVASLLDENRVLLDQWGAVEWPACDPDAVAQAAGQLLRDADRLTAIALLAVAEHDTRGGVRADGDATTGDWASRQTKTSKDTGRRTATKAKRIRKASKTAKAAAEGRLSSEQADRLAAARTEDNADLFDQREEELINAASGSLDDAVDTASRFRAETGETPEDRAGRLHRRRTASCWDDDDGMTQGRQSLSGDGAATWKAAWDAFTTREFTARDPHDHRTRAQKRADAAVALARHALTALNTNQRVSPRASVTVLVRYEDLIADNIALWAGEDTTTGEPLTGAAVRRLCCDADIIRMVTRGDSQIIDVGRRTRTIPTPTRRAVEARDGGCTYPACHHNDGVEVHHIKLWAKLGRTDLNNLACLCWRHHRLGHENSWTVELDPHTQRTIWTAPDGRKLIGQRRATTSAKRTTAAA